MGNQVNSKFVAGDSLNSILPSPQAGDSSGYLEPGPPGISQGKAYIELNLVSLSLKGI